MTKAFDPYYDLIIDEDLAKNEYPRRLDELQARERKSKMAQIMTRELWDKYKNYVTKNGWTLARAINTGVVNPDSIKGLHAGDMESYDDFQLLFKGVIESYHVGFDMETMKHVSDMDAKKIEIALTEQAKRKIISTRIRCAINLSLFLLNLCGTKESRESIAALMEAVFSTFTDDLVGKFYRHTEMTNEEINLFVEKGFLFRGGDKMQAASGYHTDWPHGRGIFVSNDEKFLVWLNEGDHMRIISLEQGTDIYALFERFVRGASAVEKGVQEITKDKEVYLKHPVLGYITCCSTNLGTGMRASVHILIPKLIAKVAFEGVDKIARSMNCQARGRIGEIHGLPDQSNVMDCVDISNIRRLGYPEYILIEDMIKCVNVISKLEDNVSCQLSDVSGFSLNYRSIWIHIEYSCKTFDSSYN